MNLFVLGEGEFPEDRFWLVLTDQLKADGAARLRCTKLVQEHHDICNFVGLTRNENVQLSQPRLVDKTQLAQMSHRHVFTPLVLDHRGWDCSEPFVPGRGKYPS